MCLLLQLLVSSCSICLQMQLYLVCYIMLLEDFSLTGWQVCGFLFCTTLRMRRVLKISFKTFMKHTQRFVYCVYCSRMSTMYVQRTVLSNITLQWWAIPNRDLIWNHVIWFGFDLSLVWFDLWFDQITSVSNMGGLESNVVFYNSHMPIRKANSIPKTHI